MKLRNNEKWLSYNVVLVLFFSSCVGVEDTHKSKELVSSTGEKIYINTLNWGITDDNQYTVISKDVNRLRARSDTLNAVKGFSPFVYRFNRDTLSIYYLAWKDIKVSDSLQSIKIAYHPLQNKEFMDIMLKVSKGEYGYNLVP
jgi:hypothetical protein